MGRAVLRSLPGMRRTGRLPFNVAGIPGLGPKRDNPDAWPVPRPTLLAPRLSFNSSITAHRRFAFRSFALDDIKAVKNATATTINDVILAVCTGALRIYLAKHDELPDRALVAMVPVSAHTDDSRATFGNRVSIIATPLPVHLPDPLDRLHVIHESMKDAKDVHNAIGADLLQDFTQFATPALAARAARVAFRTRMASRSRPLFNLVVSNVPGPNFPLYLAGSKMLHWYPVSFVNDGSGINITVHSYNGQLDFGLLSCRELVPELWSVMDFVSESLDELIAAATIPV
jgi:WS/DGAT/MGAT family acyltransferase